MGPDPVNYHGVDQAGLPESVQQVCAKLAALRERARGNSNGNRCIGTKTGELAKIAAAPTSGG